MPIRRAVMTAAAALALSTGALAPAIPASAETPAEVRATGSASIERSVLAPAAAEEHCALDIGVAASAEELGLEAPEPICFSSIEEVERYLERRSVAAADSRLAATASIAVGRIYKDADKGGSSLTFWGSSGCAGASFGFPSLSSSWSTSVSSLTGLSGCWATAYAATSYSGARVNCMPYCSSLGGLNDRVRSLVFRPTGSVG
ncbi:hypothetical protein [Agromyces lapidis]|uniref:Uncharacterized protein n=1 Tax=Agromyces lapidis TaxID=279574 RepID=A0ABV5SN46_9MICO|nr:hypothetical protein [Agromyces lapidis]